MTVTVFEVKTFGVFFLMTSSIGGFSLGDGGHPQPLKNITPLKFNMEAENKSLENKNQSLETTIFQWVILWFAATLWVVQKYWRLCAHVAPAEGAFRPKSTRGRTRSRPAHTSPTNIGEMRLSCWAQRHGPLGPFPSMVSSGLQKDCILHGGETDSSSPSRCTDRDLLGAQCIARGSPLCSSATWSLRGTSPFRSRQRWPPVHHPRALGSPWPLALRSTWNRREADSNSTHIHCLETGNTSIFRLHFSTSGE